MDFMRFERLVPARPGLDIRVTKSPLLVIDSNTAFGISPSNGADLSQERLLKELHAHGITAALSFSMRRWTEGNSESLAVSKANPTILPVATINPKRYLGWREEVNRCLKEEFVCFRFFPSDADPELSFEVSSAPFQMILDQLAPSKVPIMLSADGQETPTKIAQATVEYRGPVILADIHYMWAAEVMAVMQRYDHIYAETHRLLATPKALEIFVQEVGAERLLFGSGACRHPIQSPLNAILQADVSPEDKRLVLGQNACRLFHLDGERLLTRVSDVPEVRLVVPPGPIIDTHCHLGISNITYPVPDVGPATFVEEMARFDVERSVVSSLSAIEYDIAAGNCALAKAIEGHASLLGLVVVNPNHLDLSCQEMDRCYRFDNFVGAKLHCYYSGQATGSLATRALIAEVAKRGKPLLIHTDGPDVVSALQEIARAHPNLPIIVAHGGFGGADWHESFWAVKETDNIYVDLCTSAPRSGRIREAVDALGPERVLFGSDADALDRGFVLGSYADAGLTLIECKMVMYDNAKRLFKL